MRIEDRIAIAKSQARDYGCSEDNPPRCETCRFFDGDTSVCFFGPPQRSGPRLVCGDQWCSQWWPRFDSRCGPA